MTTSNSINANSITPLIITDGGTAVTSVTTTPTATSFAGWDINANFSANNILSGYATTVTTGGNTALIVSSPYNQFFTGTSSQNLIMPTASTLVLGQSWLIINKSSGSITIIPNGTGTITTLTANTQAIITCILTSGSTPASWNFITVPIVDSWIAYTPTFTGLGTVTTINIFSRRVGPNLEIMGTFTTGTCTAVPAQMTLGYQGTNSNVTSSNTVIATLFTAGNVVGNQAFAGAIYANIAQNVGYVSFGIQNALNSGLAQANGTAVFNNSSLNSIQCSVPIAGW